MRGGVERGSMSFEIKIEQKLDKTISISMKRDFDSLNVSVAGAIMIHRMSYGIK